MTSNIYFFDIDNTLLDHTSNAIPDSALVAIADLKQAGHTVVIATGRSYKHAKLYIDLIQPSYTITINGARIIKDGEEVLTIRLAREPLVELFGWMRTQGHYFGVNDGQVGHISASVPCALEPLGAVDITVQSDLGFYARQDIYQGWLFFDEAMDAELFPEILRRFPDFDLVRWHRTAVDVLPRAINKWSGCQWVLAQTGFEPHQAVAFGDGLNDIEMLQGVGLGVAMDNGHPALKAVANRIAPAMHLDGIARVLDDLARTSVPGCVEP